MTFGLCFAPSATAAVTMSSPPAVHLAGLAAGSIAMMIGQPEFAPVVLRDAHAPLAGLWLWSMAVAWDLLPVTLRLEAEEGPVSLSAQPQADGQILVVVARGHAKAACDEDRVQGIRWQQTRAEFLRHWGSAWTKCLANPAFDAGGHWAIDPEPVRDMPWVTLGKTPELEAPSWPMPARIAWFYLQMAHHLRSKNHGCEYTADPARWVARELALARMGVQCANAAWAALHSTPAPNQGEEARIAVVLARAQQLPKELSRELEVSLHHDYIETQSAAFEHVARVAEALLPQLPITPGCHFADEKGRRSTLVYRQGRRWTLWREDGMLVQEDAFRARFHTLWRRPVAYGPHFDPERLDGIDRRRLRFFLLQAGPWSIVCPVCGYPGLDEEDEPSPCDICGLEHPWRFVDRAAPSLDTAVDEAGNLLSPTLRQRRVWFAQHGDAWPPDHAGAPDDPVPVSALRNPEHQSLVRECMAEWDAWLEQPDLHKQPEPVWQRWVRLQNNGCLPSRGDEA
jgi:hypothetical protein